jgi:hypothetical protein
MYSQSVKLFWENHIDRAGFSLGDLAAFEKVLSPNYLRHCQAMPPPLREIHGIETMTNFLKEFFDAVPDYQEKIDLIMTERDKVAYITTGTSTQTGQMGAFPPSGKR